MRVYVSEEARENAIAQSSTPNKLARALLEAVFTRKALLLCHATGKDRARENRRMLNQKGLRAIYTFVRSHAEEKNWCRTGWTNALEKSMKRSICKKLTEAKSDEVWNSDRKYR